MSRPLFSLYFLLQYVISILLYPELDNETLKKKNPKLCCTQSISALTPRFLLWAPTFPDPTTKIQPERSPTTYCVPQRPSASTGAHLSPLDLRAPPAPTLSPAHARPSLHHHQATQRLLSATSDLRPALCPSLGVACPAPHPLMQTRSEPDLLDSDFKIQPAACFRM